MGAARPEGTSVSWTFGGRDAELDLVDRALRTPGSVTVLAGPAGVGKTSLALAAAAGTGFPDVVVRATAGAGAATLVALVPLLEHLDIDADDRGSHAGLVSALGRAISASDAPITVVVDDAPRLDAMSAAVLHQVVGHEALRMLLTARDGEQLPDPFDHLLDEGSATWVRVDPLRLDESAAVLRASVDPNLLDDAIQRLHEASGGNPLILRELVAGTVDADGFERHAEGTTLVRPVPSTRLVDLVTRRFARLGAVQLELLELLAVAQPLPLAELRSLDGADAALVDLEAVGLIAHRSDGVGLDHPVYDEVIRSTVGALRLDRRRVRAAELLESAGGLDAEFRATCLRVRAGHEVEGDALVVAARRAFGLLDHDLAAMLAESAIGAGERFWGNLVLGGACSALGDLDRASTVLELAAAEAVDDEQRALAAQRLGMHLAVRVERPSAALQAAESVLEELEDDEWIRFLAADIAKWRMMAGRPVDDVMALRGDADSGEVVGLLNDHMIRALVGVMNGDLVAADASIALALPVAMTHPEVLPNAQDLLRLSKFLSLTFAADLSGASELAEVELAAAARDRADSVGMWSYALAMMDLYCGRASDAARRAAIAGERLEWRDFTGLRPAARALSATALAQTGRIGEARAELEGLAPDALDDPKVDLLDAQARAWIAVGERDLDGAAKLLAAAAHRAMEHQHRCLGALVAHEAVRLGRSETVVEDLVEAAADGGSALVTLLADHAVAANERDWAALESVSVRLESVGMLVAAADASAQAARLHRRNGRSEAARRASRRAGAVAASCDGPRGAAADEPVVTLTRRELEVAELAAGRFRSREIADRLDISVRTVDNHLASVYRKLGVVNRAELAVAMTESGWSR